MKHWLNNKKLSILIISFFILSCSPSTSGIELKKLCSPSNISIQNFKAKTIDECRRTPCPIYKFTFEIINNCKYPTGVQVKITARDKNGMFIDSSESWPASNRNIPSKDIYPVSYENIMPFDPKIKNFDIQIIDTHIFQRP